MLDHLIGPFLSLVSVILWKSSLAIRNRCWLVTVAAKIHLPPSAPFRGGGYHLFPPFLYSVAAEELFLALFLRLPIIIINISTDKKKKRPHLSCTRYVISQVRVENKNSFFQLWTKERCLWHRAAIEAVWSWPQEESIFVDHSEVEMLLGAAMAWVDNTVYTVQS